MAVTIGTLTIPAGEALSDGLDCAGNSLLRLTMPSLWTPANITFQLSTDGAVYSDLFDAAAREVMVPLEPGSTVVFQTDGNLRALGFVRIRSGSRDHPVIQEADREFTLSMDDGRGAP